MRADHLECEGPPTIAGTTSEHLFRVRNTAANIALTIDKSGGIQTLSGPNTYTGGTTLSEQHHAEHQQCDGSRHGRPRIRGTFTIDNTTASAITLTNNNALTLSDGSLTFTGTKDLSFGSGALTISGANRTITTTAGTLTVGAVNDGARWKEAKEGGHRHPGFGRGRRNMDRRCPSGRRYF